ncbi:MAG: FHA domain-containing protein [Candidatus Dadabacteria bacterium]|nr:MAG: FHA domain-containing protein [Candidatus Dadabacteria bacterium]
MSTDSTELTFVRCPSCRSLVPAVSTRCRMCGASLEADGGTSQTSGEDQGIPRVRQKTITTPQKPPIAAEDPDTADKDVLSDEEKEFEDPLSAFIEEVEVEEEDSASVEEDLTGEEEPAPQPADELISEPQEQVASAKPATEEESTPVNASVEETPPEHEPARAKPQVKIESGPRRGKTSGLSFGKKPAGPARPQDEPAPHASTMPKVAPERTDNVSEPVVKEESTAVPDKKGSARSDAVRSRPGSISGKEPARERIKSAEPGVKGRLFGWLVSYESPEGSAIELREGQFFVTSTSLKSNDLILDDPSVSTPHAMVRISKERGMLVQDLLSEEGVYVRRAGEKKYRRIEDSETVEHGDWIRFGKVEFLVSLIAHVGEQ